MRPLTATLLLLSLALAGIGCEKNVQEVRRKDNLQPVAPAEGSRTALRKDTPVAPSGAPVGLPGGPVTPGGRG